MPIVSTNRPALMGSSECTEEAALLPERETGSTRKSAEKSRSLDVIMNLGMKTIDKSRMNITIAVDIFHVLSEFK